MQVAVAIPKTFLLANSPKQLAPRSLDCPSTSIYILHWGIFFQFANGLLEHSQNKGIYASIQHPNFAAEIFTGQVKALPHYTETSRAIAKEKWKLWERNCCAALLYKHHYHLRRLS